jgi:hypothetical protein
VIGWEFLAPIGHAQLQLLSKALVGKLLLAGLVR